MGDQDGRPPDKSRGQEEGNTEPNASGNTPGTWDEWDADNWELIGDPYAGIADPPTRDEAPEFPPTSVSNVADLSWEQGGEEEPPTALYSRELVRQALGEHTVTPKRSSAVDSQESPPLWDDPRAGDPPDAAEEPFPRDHTDPMAHADLARLEEVRSVDEIQDIDMSDATVIAELAKEGTEPAIPVARLRRREASGSWALEEAEDTAPTVDAWQKGSPGGEISNVDAAVAGPWEGEPRDTMLVASSDIGIVEEVDSADAITNDPDLTPAHDSVDIVLGSEDLAALLSDEDFIEDDYSPDDSEVLEPWAMSGVHMIEEQALASTHLPPLLEEIERSVGDGRSLPRYTRQLVRELLAELVGNPPQDPTQLACYTHELADTLRRSLPAEHQHLARRLDEIAVTTAPGYLPGHHALLAHAMHDGEWQLYVDRMERFAERLHLLGNKHPAVNTALASVLVELALLLEFKLEGREESVRGLTERGIQSADGYMLPALNALRLGLSKGDGELATRAYRELGSLTTMPLQAAVTFDLAVYLWTDQQNVDEAVNVARGLFAEQRSDLPSMYPLQLLAWQSGRRDLEYEVSRSRIAQVVAEGKELGHRDSNRRTRLKERAAGMFHRLHELYLDEGSRDRAEASLHDALQVAPNGVLHLHTALELATSRSDWPLVDELLSRLFDLARSSDRQAALAHRRAHIYTEHLADPAGARDRLLEALEANPAYVPGAIELGRMFLQEQQYEPLFELWKSLAYDPEAEEELGDDDQSRWFDDIGAYRRGDIQETLLRKPDDAFGSYLRAFVDESYDYVVACALERTGFVTSRYREVAEAFLRAADATDDRLRQSDLCWKASQLLDRELDDVDAAISATLRFLQVDPTHLPALKALIILYRRGGYLVEACDVLEQVVNLEENENESRILREWLGYLSSRLGDSERSKRVLDALIEDAPNSVTAQSLLRSSLLRARDWDGLETFCVHLAESVDDTRRRDLLLQAALIARTQLNDNARARRHLESALQIDPAWGPVLDLLEEVYGEESDDEALLELLVDRAAFAADAERGRMLEQAAAICVDRLSDPTRAEALYLEAHALLPDDAAVWSGLSDLLRTRQAWPELTSIIEQRLERSLDRSTRIVLMQELGFIRAEVTREPELAIRVYRSILDVASDDVSALHHLARLYADQNNPAALAEVHGRLADAVVDVDDRVHHLMEQIRYETRAQGRVPFARIERVLGIAPGHPGVLRYLRQHKLTREDRPRLIALLSGRPPARHDLQNAFDLYELAQLHEDAERLEEAREVYERVTHVRPDFLPAHVGLIRILDALGDVNASARRCGELADMAHTPESRLPLLRAAADRWRRAGKADESARILEGILVLDPDDKNAFASLRQHYQTIGDVDRLSALLASHTETESPEARIEMLREIAQLHTVEGGSSTYRSALEELVERVPDDVDAQQRLAQLEEAESRYARAAQRWEEVIRLLHDPAESRRTRLHVAAIWRDRCDMPQNAIDHYTELLRQQRNDAVALEGMAEALADKGDVQPAVVCYRRLFKAVDNDAVRVRVGLALGALYRDQLKDTQEAARWFVAVGELDPTCEAATEALIALGSAPRRGETRQRPSRSEGMPSSADTPAIGVGADQLDKAIRVQLDAVDDDPWALGRYEQLAQLMRLRDPRDVRVGLLASLLQDIGRRSHDIERSLDAHRRRFATPRGPLGAQEYNIVLHPWSRGAHYDLFARLGEALGRVVGPKLDPFHVEDEDLIGPDTPLARFADDLARALGVATPRLYYHPSNDLAVGIALSPMNAIVLGEKLMEGVTIAPVHRFRVAHALESIRDAKAVALRLSTDELEGLLGSTVNALFPDLKLPYTPPAPSTGTGRHLDVRAVGDHVARSLPRRKRRELRQLAERASTTQWDVDRWREGLALTRLRSALLMCPDLGAAARMLSARAEGPLHEDELRPLLEESGQFAHLVKFALSDDAALVIQQIYP